MESLRLIKDRIFFLITKFTLRDYYLHLKKQGELVERTYQLLMVLGEVSEKFSLKDLYDRPVLKAIYQRTSERTARRDLERMTKLGLLLFREGLYELNWKALERE
jgi:hypothetical protein